ncbi:hypothetical protein acdb102_17130 [Acidothermaceae bacterium B102]|nr:hypothetical protein acdb102_17130 [Acidothermaceae bacterium B102]
MTSSSDPYVVRSPGLVVHGSVVRDSGRAEDVDVTQAATLLLDRLDAGPRRLSSLCDDPSGIAAVRELSQLGMASVLIPLRPGLGRASGGRLGDVLRLGVRRLPVGPSSFPGVLLACLVLVLGARKRLLLALSTLLGLVTLLLPDVSAARVVDAALAPVLLAVTVVAHEAGHLAALRRLPGRAEAGALMVGRTHLSVLRPHLSGSALRQVSLAGPVTGMLASLLLAGLSGVAPMCGVAGLLGVAWHAANLLPAAPDGCQLWHGEDPGVATASRAA